MRTLQRQSGLTLIELMIAMVLALVIAAAVGTIMVTSNRVSLMSETTTERNDAGRYGIATLERKLMMAGFDPDDRGARHFSIPCQAGIEEVVCTSNSDSGTGDRIAIERIASPGPDAITCDGAPLTDDSDVAITTDVNVTDVFWVEELDRYSALRCRSFDTLGTARAAGAPFAPAQTLVAGILSMHALYGVSTVDPGFGPRNVSYYNNADNITDWGDVYSIRVSLLTSALSASGGQQTENRFFVLDAAPYDFEDNRSRQVFSSTITLLN